MWTGFIRKQGRFESKLSAAICMAARLYNPTVVPANAAFSTWMIIGKAHSTSVVIGLIQVVAWSTMDFQG